MNDGNNRRIPAGIANMSKSELLKACCYVLAGVIIAFLLFAVSDIGDKKHAQTSGTNGSDTVASVTPVPSYNWQENIKTVEKTIGSTFMDIKTKEREPMSIAQTAELTGDKTEEALIALGSGGAYTEYMTLMRINYANKDGSLTDNSKPVIAQFKQRDGTIGPLLFAAGSSVSNGETVELVPTTKSVYSGGWSIDQVNPDAIECSLDVYVWNEKTAIFEFNKALSDSSLSSFCSKITSSR
jgi:hypothetical protein